MIFELSADQREIQSLAREFARAEIEPNASEWDRAHGWSITGTKQWITNGGFGGTVLVFARTDPDTPGAKGVSAFILDGSDVRVTREEEKLGLNSSSTVDLALDEVKVGRDRLLHEEGKGFT